MNQRRPPKGKPQNNDNEIVCLCNNVPKGRIEDAIRGGCNTPTKIYDATTAGVGSCGGTCRVKLFKMLDQYQKDGTFPKTLRAKKKRRR